jgi:hypothetical protein
VHLGSTFREPGAQSLTACPRAKVVRPSPAQAAAGGGVLAHRPTLLAAYAGSPLARFRRALDTGAQPACYERPATRSHTRLYQEPRET